MVPNSDRMDGYHTDLNSPKKKKKVRTVLAVKPYHYHHHLHNHHRHHHHPTTTRTTTQNLNALPHHSTNSNWSLSQKRTSGYWSRFQKTSFCQVMFRSKLLQCSPSPYRKGELRREPICRYWSVKMSGAIPQDSNLLSSLQHSVTLQVCTCQISCHTTKQILFKIKGAHLHTRKKLLFFLSVIIVMMSSLCVMKKQNSLSKLNTSQHGPTITHTDLYICFTGFQVTVFVLFLAYFSTTCIQQAAFTHQTDQKRRRKERTKTKCIKHKNENHLYTYH